MEMFVSFHRARNKQCNHSDPKTAAKAVSAFEFSLMEVDAIHCLGDTVLGH